MADTKITSLLTPQVTTNPATDVLPIVNIADTSMASSGSTRKITVNTLLGAGGTATLASATITGALTVDTTTLVVDPTNDRVGIGTATPAAKLIVRDGSNRNLLVSSDATQLGSAGIAIGSFTDNAAGYAPLSIIAGTSMAFGMNGTTAMTLNSTGLGVGVTPYVSWPATSKALQLGASSSIEGRTNDGSRTTVYSNTVWNGTNLIYQNEAAAAYYQQAVGVHSWHTNSNTPSAGNTATFTQAMTLDASGNLLVGVTSALASGSTFQNLGSARQVLTLKGNDATSYTLGIWSATTTGDNLFAYFGTEASLTVRGGISYNRGGGLIAYNTTSDYRAKDIIGPVSNSGSLIDSLKVYVGKMKGATIARPMLIAHEAQEVAPYAVTGTKDEVDAEGKPKYQQMDASALVPLLIAEIQSLRARVQTLEAR